MRRREECFTTLQGGHLLYHSKANNGQSGVGFLVNRKWKDHIVRVNSISPRVAEHVTKRYKLQIVQVYAPTISYSDENINNFYNDVAETLGKPNHYTIVMGDFNAQIGKRTNPMETAMGKFWARIEKGKRRHLGRMGNLKKVRSHEYHVPKKADARPRQTDHTPLLDKQGREIHDQDKIIERIEEFYIDSEQNTVNIIHTIMGSGSSTMRYEEWDRGDDENRHTNTCQQHSDRER